MSPVLASAALQPQADCRWRPALADTPLVGKATEGFQMDGQTDR